MSETENKNEVDENKEQNSSENNQDSTESFEPSSSLSGFNVEEENISETCNRFLNIFRQIHVLKEDLIQAYNDELRNISEDAKFELYSMPGGLELIDYITFVRTGEKINTRRLRARQKQEEELGVAPTSKTEVKEQVQQPVVQYVPMPMPNGEGGGDTSVMMAQMAQMMSVSQSSFSSSELANVLSENQKNIMNVQTKNFLEGQKNIVSSQAKGFLDSQKELLEMQNRFVLDAQKSLIEVQSKFINETKEALDKSQNSLLEMQKQMILEITSKLDSIVSKVSEKNLESDCENKSTIDYDSLSEIQEKLVKIQTDAMKDASSENLKGFEKVAEGIKEGLKSLSFNVSIPSFDVSKDNVKENDDSSFKINHSKKSKESVFVDLKEEEEKNKFKKIDDNEVIQDFSDEQNNNKNIISDFDEVPLNKFVSSDDNIDEISDNIDDIKDNIDDEISDDIDDEIVDDVEDIKEKEFIIDNTSSAKVDDIAPLNNFSNNKDDKGNDYFIPEQGSANNFPTPGVMTKEQKDRVREGNVGFAINDGSYKSDKKSYDPDLFSNNKISPKAVSRFKSKKSDKKSNNVEREDKKGIFSVFKKMVGNEENDVKNNNKDEDV